MQRLDVLDFRGRHCCETVLLLLHRTLWNTSLNEYGRRSCVVGHARNTVTSDLSADLKKTDIYNYTLNIFRGIFLHYVLPHSAEKKKLHKDFRAYKQRHECTFLKHTFAKQKVHLCIDFVEPLEETYISGAGLLSCLRELFQEFS